MKANHSFPSADDLGYGPNFESGRFGFLADSSSTTFHNLAF
jgi:hypothetical protein